MMKLQARIEKDGITAASTHTAAPSWVDANDGRPNWFRVTLRYAGRQMTTPFGMGSAYDRGPTAAEVIQSLLSDASGCENAQSFEDWADEYGEDTDSRSAERTYKQVEAQTAKLRQFLGDAYDAYLWQTEGL